MEFPFSAVVGQEYLKAALLVAAVDPSIGGVLIWGEKGTGKTTLVRGLPAVLPKIEVRQGCPFHCVPGAPGTDFCVCSEDPDAPVVSMPLPLVELPLNATEDRLIGALKLESVLSRGVRELEPGLLAAAHRGVLYVDEVNLLDDHLVDLLLDVMASGRNRIEREGVSAAHPARFVLIGTMNPEEGELRPQFLDRFGMSVGIHRIADEQLRCELLRRRMAFDSAPEEFAREWQEEDQRIADRVRGARQRLPEVRVSPETLSAAVQVAAAVGSTGHRGEVALVKTARAFAALSNADAVGCSHVKDAARLVLPHRMPRSLTETMEDVGRRLESVLEQAGEGGQGGRERGESGAPGESVHEVSEDDFSWDDEDSIQVEGAAAAGSIVFDFLKKKNSGSTNRTRD